MDDHVITLHPSNQLCHVVDRFDLDRRCYLPDSSAEGPPLFGSAPAASARSTGLVLAGYRRSPFGRSLSRPSSASHLATGAGYQDDLGWPGVRLGPDRCLVGNRPTSE